MEIEIAAHFTCADWDRLKSKLDPKGHWAGSGSDWRKAIEVVRGRIQERFLRAADRLKPLPHAGFAILGLDCLLIETIWAFKTGKHAKNPQESRQAYEAFLTSSSRFGTFFSPPIVQEFYTCVRNGLLHDGETRGGWIVKANPQYALLDRQGDGFTVVNRKKFHNALAKEFEEYIQDLSDPTKNGLRGNLISALTDLCARSKPSGS